MFEVSMAHVYKHMKIMQKWVGELAWLFVYPLIGLLSLGIFAHFIISSGAPIESLYFIIVGVTAWNFFAVSQRAITYALTLEIWNSCTKHLFLTKSSIKDFLIGNILFALMSASVTLLIVVPVAFYVFGFNILNAGIILPFALIGILLHAIAEGLLLNSLLIRKSNEWMALIWIIPGITMVFSGVYYPVSSLPNFLQVFSYILPTTYAISAIRNSLTGLMELAIMDLIFCFILIIIYMIFSTWYFKKSIKAGKKTGRIATMDD